MFEIIIRTKDRDEADQIQATLMRLGIHFYAYLKPDNTEPEPEEMRKCKA